MLLWYKKPLAGNHAYHRFHFKSSVGARAAAAAAATTGSWLCYLLLPCLARPTFAAATAATSIALLNAASFAPPRDVPRSCCGYRPCNMMLWWELRRRRSLVATQPAGVVAHH